jgi:hypothetical protein
MNFILKNLAQRLLGDGPVSVRPFDEVRAGREKPRGMPEVETVAGELAQAPADSCQYEPTYSLLGQTPEPDPASGVPRYQASLLAVSPRRRLLLLTDAGVAGEDAVVYCPRQRVAVEETVRQWTQPAARHPLLAAPRFPPAQDLPGLTLSLGTLDGGGFYHFLMETLPRLHLARPWLDRIDNFLANGAPGSFQERWLVHAGVPAAKIRWLSGHSHFHCDEIMFTNPLCSDSEPTPWLIAAIRDTLCAPPAARPGSRRVWISRNDAGSRVLAWENELLATLGDFERVELARLAPAEQMRLMASAGVVAGPHGAGLTNLVFCAPGTRLIELLPEGHYRPLFGRLALAARCVHAWAAVDFTRVPANLDELTAQMSAFAA